MTTTVAAAEKKPNHKREKLIYFLVKTIPYELKKLNTHSKRIEASFFHKNKMPLSDCILHTCVGHPTYFDTLPGDVLSFCIMPFLDWEDRIHLNMLTPPGDRTPPKKIPKDRIIGNRMLTCVPKMIAKLKAVEKLISDRIFVRRVSQMSITEACLEFLRCFKSENSILLLQYSSKFRQIVAEKMEEFSRPETMKVITRIAQRNEMKSLVNHILQQMSTHPFCHDIHAKRWLSARVTQNETNLQCGGRLADGTCWYRKEGDIYNDVE
jgi:hypothetical protein